MQRSETEQLDRELAEVKADRDHLAGLVKQLATTSATLEAYTINDRQGCLKTQRGVCQQINSACTAMQAGTAEAKNAAAHLSSASESLDHALGAC